MDELPIKIGRVTPFSELFSIDDIPVKPSRGTIITPVKPARVTPTIATTPTFITRAVIPEVTPVITPLSAVNDEAYWDWAKKQNFDFEPVVENGNAPEYVIQSSPNSKRKTILIVAVILLVGYLIFKKK